MAQNRDNITTDLPDEPEERKPPASIPQLDRKKPLLLESEFARILIGFLVGSAVGSVWVMVEASSGARLMGLWMLVAAWVISSLMRRTLSKETWQFDLVTWRSGLPAVAVTLLVCFILDMVDCFFLYYQQADCFPLSSSEDRAFFWHYWNISSLPCYVLAPLLAYYNSFDRTFTRERVGKSPEPPRLWRTPTFVKIGLGIVVSFGWFGFYGWLGTRTSILDMAMSPDGEELAVIENGRQGNLVVHNLGEDRSDRIGSLQADHVAWSPDGEWFGCAKNHTGSKREPSYAELRLVNRSTNATFPLMTETHLSLHCLAFSPDGQILAAGASDILIYDTDDRLLVDRLNTGHSVHSLAFSPQGTLASGLSDGQIVFWKPGSNKPLRSWHAHDTAISCLAFHPRRDVLFSLATEEKAACAWDTTNNKQIQRYSLDADWTTSLAVSPEGRALAVCGGSFHRRGEVRVFDSDSGELRRVFSVAANTVTSVAFSGDAQTLFAGTRPPLNPFVSPHKGQIYRWNLATGEELPPLQ